MPGSERRFMPGYGSRYVPFSTRAPTTVLGTVTRCQASTAKPGREIASPPWGAFSEDCNVHPAWRSMRRGPSAAVAVEQGQGHDLSHELHEHARGDQGRDDLVEGEEGGDDGHRAEHVEGDVGEVAGRMEAAEHAEEVPFHGGGVGDAGVAEQQGEHGA